MMFRKMKIGTRLTLAFIVVLLITLVISILASFRMGLMNQNTRKIITDLYPRTVLAHEIIDNVNMISSSVRNSLLFVDQKMISAEIDRIHEAQKKTADLIQSLESETASDKGRDLIGNIRNRGREFDASLEKLLQLGSTDGAAATDYMINTFRPVNTAYLESIEALIAYQGELMKGAGDASEDSYAASLTFMIALTVLAALLSAGLGIWIIRSILGHLHRAVEVATSVSSGDLTLKIEVTGEDELGQLLRELKHMNENLGRIVGEVRSTTETITTASREIAQGNVDLSSRTEQQASSLEQTASSMQELLSIVRKNADNAKQAYQLTQGACDVADKSGKEVDKLVSTMNAINESSRRIEDIISVIDGIAFQTNILALNAAVEAARAGEQGRGFAVVAGEVRNLAQRSAGAAKEIKQLIGGSVEKVSIGASQVKEAAETIDDVVTTVQLIASMMKDVAAASAEQSHSIEQINEAIVQMDEVTQQNSALVEQSAATAEAMRDQAVVLMHTVSTFKLDGMTSTSPHVSRKGPVPESPSRSELRQPAQGISLPVAAEDKDDEWKEY